MAQANNILIPKVMMVLDYGFYTAQLSFIEEILQDKSYLLRANSGTETKYSRRIYMTDKTVYKIWKVGYYCQENLLLGIVRGFINLDIAPALCGVIFDDAGNCRGYWMHAIVMHVAKVNQATFRDKLTRHERKTGCKYTDFHAQNLGHLDGHIGLVDLENVEAQHETKN